MSDLLARPREVDAEFARIVDELTRRGFLSGGAGAAALLGLAACGPEKPAPAATPTTRLVDSARGAIRVPADPRRVVSIQPSATATLYDVGVSSLGVYDEGSEYISPRYRGKWEAATKIGSNSEINVEKIAALNPDLIIGLDYEWNTDVYDKVTAVAPTVIAPATSWQDTAHAVADAVNRGSGLAALRRKVAERGAQIAKTYADVLAATTWDILQGGFTEGSFWVYGPNSDPGRVLSDAGIRFASATREAATSKDPGVGTRAISYENIELLRDADVIGYYADYDGKPNNLGSKLFAQTLWKDLPAVKAGRLVPIPDFLVGGYGDVLAMLDEVEAGLKKIQENQR